ncbi:MAG: flagellar basal body P-ring formation protein FlgA [Saccharospirillaceae bacterium]|nr:flagellar basal body P-ring formation protein FlgA [Pseudomonadales bacterium]NRB80217.1 flagellar basal body P-ring formation protein FlgA [Saccharospirillaceae bacterium]
MNNFIKKIIFIALVVIYVPLLNANELEGIDFQIRQYIYEHHNYMKDIGDEIGDEKVELALIIDIKAVWKQNKLKNCKEPLIFESSKNKYLGSLSLKAICKSSNWKMYIPVYVGKLERIITLKTNVDRGEELTSSDLSFTILDVGKLTKGYFTDLSQLKEKKAVRHLIAGHVLNPLMVDDVDLVTKGDSVLIMVVKGVLKVQMPGIALASGKRGKQISVKNRSSNRIVKAVIKEKGLVEINI